MTAWKVDTKETDAIIRRDSIVTPDVLAKLREIECLSGDGRRTANLPAINRIASTLIAKATGQ